MTEVMERVSVGLGRETSRNTSRHSRNFSNNSERCGIRDSAITGAGYLIPVTRLERNMHVQKNGSLHSSSPSKSIHVECGFFDRAGRQTCKTYLQTFPGIKPLVFMWKGISYMVRS